MYSCTRYATGPTRDCNGTAFHGSDAALYIRPPDGRKFGGESPLFRPIDGRNDVNAHLFRPKL